METPAKATLTTPANTAPSAVQTSVHTDLTRQQRDQLFDQAAHGIAPAHVKKEAEDPLKPWWRQIKRKLKEGYSVRQIHDMTASPEIGLNISLRSLQRFITEHKNTPNE